MSRNKELYERNQATGWKEADDWCKKHVPEYCDVRNKREFEKMFSIICQNAEICLDNSRFVYFIDTNFRYAGSIYNVTPNYERILNNGICDLYMNDSCIYARRQNSILDSMKYFTERIVQALGEQKPKYFEQKIAWFLRMENHTVESLEEALQRILFLNQLLWQTGSGLVGLGRLDRILLPFFQNDIKKNALTNEKAFEIIKEFLQELHKYYWFKSRSLLGDTGQVIILGGSDKGGVYVHNELTELFIKAVKELQLSDPKVVLRINQNTPQQIWELAVDCMASGIGSPLLANDDVIIPKLIDFGVEQEDAFNYATSACWEPLIAGKSSSMNNEYCLSFMNVLYKLLLEEKLKRLDSFEKLKERYFYYLKREVASVKKKIYDKKYTPHPLYSMFLDGCKESQKDFSKGGAKYHNVGMTTVSLGNTINALFNIHKYVFEEQRYDLIDLKKMCVLNYDGYAEATEILKINNFQYGRDNQDVVDLSNEILRFVTECTKDFRTSIGGKLKFGVSSPSYVWDGVCAKASFDGRKEGEPYLVHISNENIDSYTELLCFAGNLDYGENRFNGNVVDLMVSPSFIENHKAKLIEVLKAGFRMGVFQLQMNVISVKTLIEAKKHPEKYPNLIVRVWGFSAYFAELPEGYQDVLIARALKNEGK